MFSISMINDNALFVNDKHGLCGHCADVVTNRVQTHESLMLLSVASDADVLRVVDGLVIDSLARFCLLII